MFRERHFGTYQNYQPTKMDFSMERRSEQEEEEKGGDMFCGQ
jgi:hypothetical protein